MTEITTAEQFLLTKLFEAEGEAEASEERAKELEEILNDLFIAITKAYNEVQDDPEHKLSDYALEKLHIRAREYWDKAYPQYDRAGQLINPFVGER